MPPNPGNSRIVGNGGPISGRVIHRVAKYSVFHNACVRFSFSVLPFCKTIVIIQTGLSWELSTSVAGCRTGVGRAMKMLLLSMCMMVNMAINDSK